MMLRLFSFNSNIINYVLNFDRDSEDLLRKIIQVDMMLTKKMYSYNRENMRVVTGHFELIETLSD